MFTATKTIDGRTFRFSVRLQTKTKDDRSSHRLFWQKIINVTDGVGFGPSDSWSDAIAYAKELASDTSEWRIKQLQKRGIR